MKKIAFVFLGLLFAVSTSYAQRIKVKSGDIKKLKGETSFNIVYDYSSMSVGKFKNEADYVNKKVADYNKKEAGRGDKWKQEWVNDREEIFQPKFEKLFNKTVAKRNVSISTDNKSAKYTFVVHTVFTEPGFNVGVVKRPASINVVFKVVETANPNNVVATLTVDKSPGVSAFGVADFATGVRISEAYAKCGKALGGYLYKKVWK